MRTPKKTAPRKGASKPQRVRQWTNNELMKALTADSDGVMRRIAALEVNVERWLKGYHEDTIAQIEANRSAIYMLSQRIDAMRHEHYALAQQAAEIAPPAVPQQAAEAWVPKVGDYITVLDSHPCQRYHGKTFLVDEMALEDGHAYWGGVGANCGGAKPNDYRRPTEAEIAEHRREEEWAKIDCLQEEDGGTYTAHQINEVSDMLKKSGIPAWEKTCEEWQVGWMPDYVLFPLQAMPPKNKLPFPEFKRRLQGTIAKKEEESKPLAFGTPVKYRDRDGLYLYPDPQGSHRIALKGTPDQSACIVFAMLSEFTVIDKP